MVARPISSYARELRAALPSSAFATVPSRLVWLVFHLAVIATGLTALKSGWGGPYAMPLWSIAIGHSFAGCAFVGHETLHGAVVRARVPRGVIGWLCFLPFTLSPRLWVAWHNKVHHGNTMIDGIDPDAYPTLETYRQSRVARVTDYFTLGHGRWAGFVTLLLGFTGQSTQMLWRWGRTSGALTPREWRLAVFETLAGISVWAGVGVWLGPLAFLFGFVLPLLAANVVVTAYILTNHSLSPMSDVNDPLLNSLSVTTPQLITWMHLNFGLHVEHHLFPSMSSAHAALVRAELLSRWPDRYQSMPLLTALRCLAMTGRIYSKSERLHDPRTGREWPTLGSGQFARSTMLSEGRRRDVGRNQEVDRALVEVGEVVAPDVDERLEELRLIRR